MWQQCLGGQCPLDILEVHCEIPFCCLDENLLVVSRKLFLETFFLKPFSGNLAETSYAHLLPPFSLGFFPQLESIWNQIGINYLQRTFDLSLVLPFDENQN